MTGRSAAPAGPGADPDPPIAQRPDPDVWANPITDGRTLRRQRNVEAVMDATLELLARNGEPPSPEQVAAHCGISVSSIYRYFGSPSGMYLQAAEYRVARIASLAVIDDLGEGSLDDRIDRYLDNRLTMYLEGAPVGRVWSRMAHVNPVLLRRRRAVMDLLRQQTEAHFAPELDAMDPARRHMVTAAIDTMMQIASFDHLLEQLALTPDEAVGVCRALLVTLMTDP